MQTTNNIVSAKIIALKQKQIVLKTETGEYIVVDNPKDETNPKLWHKTMRDIFKNGLWIPVNTKLKQLLTYDWFEPDALYSF